MLSCPKKEDSRRALSFQHIASLIRHKPGQVKIVPEPVKEPESTEMDRLGGVGVVDSLSSWCFWAKIALADDMEGKKLNSNPQFPGPAFLLSFSYTCVVFRFQKSTHFQRSSRMTPNGLHPKAESEAAGGPSASSQGAPSRRWKGGRRVPSGRERESEIASRAGECFFEEKSPPDL